MSVDEFLVLPEAKPGLEFRDGQVVQKPVTNADHIRIVWRLSAAFFAYAAEHGGTGGPEGSVALAGGATADVLLPDFAFWAEGVDMGRYPLNPPTLAIEVRSPSQSLASQREKCETYVRRGVSEAWLIDPESQSVETVVSGGSWAAYRDADSIVPAVSLPGFSIRLSDVFG